MWLTACMFIILSELTGECLATDVPPAAIIASLSVLGIVVFAGCIVGVCCLICKAILKDYPVQPLSRKGSLIIPPVPNNSPRQSIANFLRRFSVEHIINRRSVNLSPSHSYDDIVALSDQNDFTECADDRGNSLTVPETNGRLAAPESQMALLSTEQESPLFKRQDSNRSNNEDLYISVPGGEIFTIVSSV